MSPTVETVLTITSSDPAILQAIIRALSPDNKQTPPNMSIEESLMVSENQYAYIIRITVNAEDLDTSIQRARSTIDEILSIVNMLLKQHRLLSCKR